MEPKIVFEDEFLLVIDKPSEMVVNKSDTTAKIETVQDWVEIYLNGFWTSQNDVILGTSETRTPESAEFFKRNGIVHRLDKETSGLLLIAKTSEAFLNLQAQFKNREVKKQYLALVHGKVVPETGEINAAVGRLPWNRERFGVLAGGREAVTKYKIYKSYKNYTLLELSPQTGRTHQIRVHLKYLGHPVVGDSFYCGRKQAKLDRQWCPRLFLHAARLEFNHPQTGRSLKLFSDLPPELSGVLERLHIDE